MRTLKQATLYTTLVFSLVLTGCAVIKVPQPTGGSRADGTITLSYKYGNYDKPQIDWNQATQTASKRCQSWGYTGAEKFGGQTEQCVNRTDFGCSLMQVNIQYQCTGKN